jgi:hypothetical protein
MGGDDETSLHRAFIGSIGLAIAKRAKGIVGASAALAPARAAAPVKPAVFMLEVNLSLKDKKSQLRSDRCQRSDRMRFPPARGTPSAEIGTSRKIGFPGHTASRSARGSGKTMDSLAIFSVSSPIAKR